MTAIYHIRRDNDSAAYQTVRELPKTPGVIEASVAPSFHPLRAAFVVLILEDGADPTPFTDLGAELVSSDADEVEEETEEEPTRDIESSESGQ